MSERRIIDDVWALIRADFGKSGEWLHAIVPWGGDRAIVVTDSSVYLAEADEQIGFVMKKVVAR
jgi:hypothetical protein